MVHKPKWKMFHFRLKDRGEELDIAMLNVMYQLSSLVATVHSY